MSIEIDTNNPLGLTTAGPGYGPFAPYPGQTGSETSAFGYTFAAFPSQSAGIQAGENWISQQIQSGRVSTVSQLVNLFSPNDQAAFTQQTGLGPNAPLDPSQSGTYAAGIAAGEGTLGAFGGPAAFGATGGLQSPSASGSTSTAITGIPGVDAVLQWLENIGPSIIFVVIGIVILIGALYALAVQAGVAPAPKEIAKGVGEAATAAAVA